MGAYENQDAYSDYLGKDTGCCQCPPGLVEVDDKNGNCKGCLTPHDGERYEEALITCSEGYVKTWHPDDGSSMAGRFVGCLTIQERSDYMAQFA